jgi:glutamate-1-semialdehyde 2,1-aminomutase
MAAAALATIEKLEREPVHERVYELGQRARTGIEGVMRSLGISAVVAGFGSVFVTYFLDPPVDRYDDLLRNDVELFVGYRHELLTRGIFELPLNLKRSHVSYAHTTDQIDRLVEATESSVAAVLQRRDRNRTGGAMRPDSRQGVASLANATTRVTGGF